MALEQWSGYARQRPGRDPEYMARVVRSLLELS
jgi:hypothetical protein